MFQFQSGSIKSTYVEFCNQGTHSFNSKVVRLKAAICSRLIIVALCFNSKVVRLKGVNVQIGTQDALFQFQSGSIKSHQGFAKTMLWGCFNSKVVRLKVRNLVLKELAVLFQFQSGSIKSICYVFELPWKNKFQFQSGSIKSCIRVSGRRYECCVSIPKWFD